MLSLYKNNNKYNQLNLIFIIKKDSSRKNKNFFSIKAFAGKLVQNMLNYTLLSYKTYKRKLP